MTTRNLIASIRVAIFCAVACCLAVCCQGSAASAATINLGSAIQGVTPSGTGGSGTPWVYDFLGADLNWGIDDAQRLGVVSSTSFINIANVTSTGAGGTINKDRQGTAVTHTPGPLSIALTGSYAIGGYLANRNTGTTNAGAAGSISLTAPGGISIGGFLTTTAVVASGSRAGNFSILTHAFDAPGDISLFSDGNVSLAGGINMSRGNGAGVVSPTQTGNLLIRGNQADVNSRAGAITIGGDILRERNVPGTDSNMAGNLNFRSSAGVSIAGNIKTESTSVNAVTAGSLSIDAQGTVSVLGSTGISLVQRTGSGGATAGSATIVTSVGDINIAGGVDLGFTETVGTGIKGILTLQTTDVSGEINLGSLDLSRVLRANFTAGSTKSYIDGALNNFSTANSGGDGSLANPFVTSQTLLRADAGQVIYYDYVPAGLNDYLGGMTYRLADLSGNAGLGGLLTLTPVPEPSSCALATLGLTVLGIVAGRRKKIR